MTAVVVIVINVTAFSKWSRACGNVQIAQDSRSTSKRVLFCDVTHRHDATSESTGRI